jgi:hypothetical protein
MASLLNFNTTILDELHALMTLKENVLIPHKANRGVRRWWYWNYYVFVPPKCPMSAPKTFCRTTNDGEMIHEKFSCVSRHTTILLFESGCSLKYLPA